MPDRLPEHAMHNWYYCEGDTRHGPFSAAEIRSLAQQGTITQDTRLIGPNGREMAARKVRGLIFAVDGASLAPPLPPVAPPPLPPDPVEEAAELERKPKRGFFDAFRPWKTWVLPMLLGMLLMYQHQARRTERAESAAQMRSVVQRIPTQQRATTAAAEPRNRQISEDQAFLRLYGLTMDEYSVALENQSDTPGSTLLERFRETYVGVNVTTHGKIVDAVRVWELQRDGIGSVVYRTEDGMLWLARFQREGAHWKQDGDAQRARHVEALPDEWATGRLPVPTGGER